MTHYAVDFVKANPSGNTTVFVLTELDQTLYGKVAAALMSERVLSAEQVGFLERLGGGRMEMMGGEFCGNASRSYAAWVAMGGRMDALALKPLQAGETKQLFVDVSGSASALKATVEDIGSPYGCFAEIDMPAPRSIEQGTNDALGQYSLVVLEGIVHGVLWQKKADRALLDVFRKLLIQKGYDATCCGLMFVENMKPLTIRPLVYIEASGSETWESSCGSGSLATVCALSEKTHESYSRLTVHQPGGTLEVSVEYAPCGIGQLKLAGSVFFTAMGVAHIDV